MRSGVFSAMHSAMHTAHRVGHIAGEVSKNRMQPHSLPSAARTQDAREREHARFARPRMQRCSPQLIKTHNAQARIRSGLRSKTPAPLPLVQPARRHCQLIGAGCSSTSSTNRSDFSVQDSRRTKWGFDHHSAAPSCIAARRERFARSSPASRVLPRAAEQAVTLGSTQAAGSRPIRVYFLKKDHDSLVGRMERGGMHGSRCIYQGEGGASSEA